MREKKKDGEFSPSLIIFLLATVSAVETATASAVGAVACYFNFVKRTVFTI